jgi:hypothetical protein
MLAQSRTELTVESRPVAARDGTRSRPGGHRCLTVFRRRSREQQELESPLLRSQGCVLQRTENQATVIFFTLRKTMKNHERQLYMILLFLHSLLYSLLLCCCYIIIIMLLSLLLFFFVVVVVSGVSDMPWGCPQFCVAAVSQKLLPYNILVF